jgi:hypothetical protein
METGFAAARKDLDQAIAIQRRDLTIWLGSVQIVGMGLLFAALRLV